MYIYLSFRAGDPVEVLTDKGSTPDSVSTGWQAGRAGRVRDPGGWSTHCSGTLERVGREVPAAPVALMMGKWQRGSSTRPVKAQQSPPPHLTTLTLPTTIIIITATTIICYLLLSPPQLLLPRPITVGGAFSHRGHNLACLVEQTLAACGVCPCPGFT